MNRRRLFRFWPTLAGLIAGTSANASLPIWTGVEVRGIAQAEVRPEIMYATGGNGLFKSQDRGRSWLPVKLPKRSAGNAIAVVPEDPGHLLVAVTPAKKGEFAYLESRDGGAHWERRDLSADLFGGPPEGYFREPDLSIDAARYGGTWWINYRGRLLRSTDQGRNWQMSATDSQSKLLLLHQGEAIYRLSGKTLYRSMTGGRDWMVSSAFDVPVGRSAVAGSDLIALAPGFMRLRIDETWFETRDAGITWMNAGKGWPGLPDWTEDAAGVRDRFGGDTFCRIRQAQEPSSLLAFCIWSNGGAMPSRSSVYRSENRGDTWSRMGDVPAAWSPIVIWRDRQDDRIAFASWMAGGLYRTEDGGQTWISSHRGLVYGSSGGGPVRLRELSLHEPPLIRAVVDGDAAEVDGLVTAGADVNAPGNYLGTAAEVDIAAIWEGIRWNTPRTSLYAHLRSLGARPPDGRGKRGLACIAAFANHPEIVEDMVDFGYDWGGSDEDGDWHMSSSEFSACLLGKTSEATTGHTAAEWVDRYIKAGRFPSVDRTILDLLDAEQSRLAVRVLEAAFQNGLLKNAPATEPDQNRLGLLAKLIEQKQYRWALRVLKSTRPIPPDCRDCRDLDANLNAVCDQSVVEPFRRAGLSPMYDACLVNENIPMAQRKRLLLLMERRHELSESSWESVSDMVEGAWLHGTSQYRRHAWRMAHMDGYVGINYKRSVEGLTIWEVFPGFPAELAGVRKGDTIVAVNGIRLTRFNSEAMAESIRGSPGTCVKLTIKRGERELRLDLTRQLLRE